jgi:hypothetical protein
MLSNGILTSAPAATALLKAASTSFTSGHISLENDPVFTSPARL